MVKDVLRLSVVESHVARVDDEFCSHVRGHRPTNDAAAQYVEYDRKKQETGHGWNVGDVCNLELIGGRGVELSVDQVGRRSCLLVADRRLQSLTTAGAPNVALAHQSRQPLVAGEDLLIAKIGSDPWAAIGASPLSIMRLDSVAEQEIVSSPLRRSTLTARVVPAG